jgi:hypothetical protein
VPFRRTLALLALVPAFARAQTALPLKHKPEPTRAAITAADLMTRLYQFADDSMQGRETGTDGHVKSTAYIAAELKRLGLQPAGDNGTYFQAVPMVNRSLDPASTISVDGTTLTALADFVATVGRGEPRSIDGAPVIFGGTLGDTVNALTAEQVRGKLVIVTAPRGGGPGGFGPLQRAFATLGEAAGIATIAGDQLPAAAIRNAAPRAGNVVMKDPNAPAPAAPLTLALTTHAAEVLLGAPVAGVAKGTAGKTVRGNPRFIETPAPARNVAGIIPGSDAKLKGQYVAIGAHNDHTGFSVGNPVDHDSLHAYNEARYAITGMLSRGERPTADQASAVAAIRINLDSVRALRPARPDSIRNGADDDGSGSVTTLELAEAFALAKEKTKRSLLFVWHVAEEKGLNGSQWYTDHPTVPRDSIVAQLNMDMVGRGEKSDLPVGGPDYLQLVGSRRLSTELGDLVEAVNKTEKMPFRFDYQFDANGHPENIYCRSDHYEYARYGIPIVFFTTGLHGDYHQVTDEPQYIAYDHMARVGQLVYDVAVKVANLDHRPVVDKPKPDPKGRCAQ